MATHPFILVKVILSGACRHNYMASVEAVDLRHEGAEFRSVGRRVLYPTVGDMEMNHLMHHHILPLRTRQIEIEAYTHLEVIGVAASETCSDTVGEFSTESASMSETETRHREISPEHRQVESIESLRYKIKIRNHLNNQES